LHPPVEGYGLLEFGAVDPLVEAGYAHTMQSLARWQDEGRPLGVG
jgi:hypothetical protein